MNNHLHSGHHCPPLPPHQHIDMEMEMIMKVYRYAKQLGDRLDDIDPEELNKVIEGALVEDSDNAVSSKAVYEALKKLKKELDDKVEALKKEFDCLKEMIVEHIN